MIFTTSNTNTPSVNTEPEEEKTTSLDLTSFPAGSLKNLLTKINDAFELSGTVKKINNTIINKADATKMADVLDTITEYADLPTGTNKNLDKLTFYIMFRLPYTHSALNSKYGDPTSGTSWTKEANDLRVSPLYKLNGKGEELNSSGNPRYDWTTLEGYTKLQTPYYTFYGIKSGETKSKEHTITNHSEISNYTKVKYYSKHGLYDDGTPEANLRRTNFFNYTSGDYIKPAHLEKIPFYFYLFAQIENHWINNFINQDYHNPHVPSNIKYSNKRRYELEILKVFSNTNDLNDDSKGGDINSPNYFVLSSLTSYNGLYIQSVEINGNTYYYIEVPPYLCNLENTYYIKVRKKYQDPMDFEILGAELEVNEDSSGIEHLIAVIDDIFLCRLPPLNASGLTLGTGIDIGASSPRMFLFNYEFRINPLNSSNFRLTQSGSMLQSSELNSSSTISDVKSAIMYILGFDSTKHSSFVDVTSNPNGGWDVSIKARSTFDTREKRTSYLTEEEYYPRMINYKDSIFEVILLEQSGNVDITPVESLRWKEKTDDDDDHVERWGKVLKLINTALDNNHTDSSPDNLWLTHSGNSFANTSERDEFEFLVKLMFGNRPGMAMRALKNNKSLMDKFSMPDYIKLIRAVYKLFFKGFGGYYSYGKKQIGSDIVDKANQVELFALYACVYNTWGLDSIESFKLAIKSHDRNELIRAVNNSGATSAKKVVEYLESSQVKDYVYRGL